MKGLKSHFFKPYLQASCEASVATEGEAEGSIRELKARSASVAPERGKPCDDTHRFDSMKEEQGCAFCDWTRKELGIKRGGRR